VTDAEKAARCYFAACVLPPDGHQVHVDETGAVIPVQVRADATGGKWEGD
jgi:hypothetical protein